jgi:hypothetical protein
LMTKGKRVSKTKDREFKFVKGRPSKRRKVAEHSGGNRFNSSLSAAMPFVDTDKRRPSTIPIEHPNLYQSLDVGRPTGTVLEEPSSLYETFPSGRPGSAHLGIPQALGSSPVNFFDEEGENGACPEAIPLGDDFGYSNHALATYPHGTDTCAASSPKSDISNALSIVQDYQSSLPPVVLFGSLADKFNGILVQCKLDRFNRDKPFYAAVLT